MAEELLLLHKVYQFVVWLYALLNRLPRHHRPILGYQLHRLALCLLTTIIQANAQRDRAARQILQRQIVVDLDTLRILIRLTKDVRLMSIKQYVYATEKLNEIGRMLTAWMRV